MGHTYTPKTPDIHGIFDWTKNEDQTWKKLFARQSRHLQGKTDNVFFLGLNLLQYEMDNIPQHIRVSERLEILNGWKIQPVPNLISEDQFFLLLSQKVFPCTTFIRIAKELDYIEEPDIFHEMFGHIPMLAFPEYSDFIQEFGHLYIRTEMKFRKYLTRIFWYTIEFGLIKTTHGIRIYGAGILSSFGETNRIFESGEIVIQDFNLFACATTPYDYTKVQPIYFCIKSFNELFGIIENITPPFLETVHVHETLTTPSPAPLSPSESAQSPCDHSMG